MASHCSWDKDQLFNKELHGFPTVRVEGGGGAHPCRVECSPPHRLSWELSLSFDLQMSARVVSPLPWLPSWVCLPPTLPGLLCGLLLFGLRSFPWRFLSHFVIRHPPVPFQVSFPSPAPPPPQLLERESCLLFTTFPESLALCLAPGRSFVSFHWLT